METYNAGTSVCNMTVFSANVPPLWGRWLDLGIHLWAQNFLPIGFLFLCFPYFNPAYHSPSPPLNPLYTIPLSLPAHIFIFVHVRIIAGGWSQWRCKQRQDGPPGLLENVRFMVSSGTLNWLCPLVLSLSYHAATLFWSYRCSLKRNGLPRWRDIVGAISESLWLR